MGASNCCANRDTAPDGRISAEVWLAKNSRESDAFNVAFCSIRGFVMLAKRGFQPGDIIVQELPVVLVFAHRDPHWMANMRREIFKMSPMNARRYCLAAHCLTDDDLPLLPPEGLSALDDEEAAKVTELAMGLAASRKEPSILAKVAARHIMEASCETAGGSEQRDLEEERLGLKLDVVAARVAKHAFKVEDHTLLPPAEADGLFYQASFVNTCSAGNHNAAYEFDGFRKTLTVRALHAIPKGEEVTLDASTRPRVLRRSGACACGTCCRQLSAVGQKPPSAAKAGNEDPEVGEVVGDLSFALSEYRDDEGADETEGNGSRSTDADDSSEGGAAGAGSFNLEPTPEPEAAKAATPKLEVSEADGSLFDFDALESQTEAAAKAPASGDTAAASEVVGRSDGSEEAADVSEVVRWTEQVEEVVGSAETIEESAADCPPPCAEAGEADASEMQEACAPMASSRSLGGLSMVSVSSCASVTESGRVRRLLSRCKSEGVSLDEGDAERVLREANGNVTKAMAGARKLMWG